MQREEAEKLLAVMVFDELDEASKAELLAYLQTDDELRERLADLRMAVKVTGDALHAGPEPVLDTQHLKRLEKLALPQSTRRGQIIRLFPKVAVAAVVFLVAGVIPFLTPRLNSQRYSMRAPQVTPETSPREEYDDFLPLSLLDEIADQMADSAETPRAARPDGDRNGLGFMVGESKERILDSRSTTQPSVPRFGIAPARRPALVTADDPGEAGTQLASPVMQAPKAAEEMMDYNMQMTEENMEYNMQMMEYEQQYNLAYGNGTELERVTETEPQRLYRIGSGREVAEQAVNGRGQYGRRFDESRSLAEVTNGPEPGLTLGIESADGRAPVTAEAVSPVALGHYGDTSDTKTPPTSLSLQAIEGVEPEARGRRERGVARQAPTGSRRASRRGGGAVKSNAAEGPEVALETSRVVTIDEALRPKLPAPGDTPRGEFWWVKPSPDPASPDGTQFGRTKVEKLTAAKTETESLLRGNLAAEGTSRTSGSSGNGLGFGLDPIKPMDGRVVATDGEDAYRSLARVESQLSSVAQSDKSNKDAMMDGGGFGGYGGGLGGGGFGGMVVADDVSPADVKLQITQGLDLVQTHETVDHFYYLKEANQEVEDLFEERQVQQQREVTRPQDWAELAKQSNSLERQPSASRPETQPAAAPRSDVTDELSLSEPAVTAKQPAPATEQWGRRGGRLNEAVPADETESRYGRSSTQGKSLNGLDDAMAAATKKNLGENLSQIRTKLEVASSLDSLGVSPSLFSEEHKVWDVSGLQSEDTTAKEVKRRLAAGPGESLTEEASGRRSFMVINAPEQMVEEILPALEELDLISGQDKSKALKKETGEPLAQVLVEAAEVDSEADETSAQHQPAVHPSDFLRRPVSPSSSPVEDIELPPSVGFKSVPVNPWVLSAQDRLSTFGLDVDTASYTLCRRYINAGYLPPIGAVRMEEFINAFDYQYPQQDNSAFAIHAQGANAPFARPGQNLTLLKVSVKARTVGRDQQKPAHLVIVVDASASMGQADRLPLVQLGLDRLVSKLSPADRVTVIGCADEARLHLEAASAQNPESILAAINAIQPVGTTNLLAGLKLGYATARRHFQPNQVNHVLLCSDGVANVGQTEADAILASVEADRQQGITLTCVGVGFGSYNDTLLEALANRGDGSYLFLDAAGQVDQVLVAPLTASLQGVAKDARIQVDFDPQRVRRYRLIGYENRDIEDTRFRDDTVDAAEVGSGQCSTALYEVELIGDPQADLGTVFVRYQDVESGQFQEISKTLSSRIIGDLSIKEAPRFYLAAGAAAFAEWLRQSEHAQHVQLSDVLRVIGEVRNVLTLDKQVAELAGLIQKAEHLPQAP